MKTLSAYHTRLATLAALLLLLAGSASAQGKLTIAGRLSLHNGARLSTATDWAGGGTFTPNNGTVLFHGTTNQKISGAAGKAFRNLIVNKPSGDVVLGRNVSVTGQLRLSAGDLNLNGKTLNLGTKGTLSETRGNTVRGTKGVIKATRTLNAPNAVNVAGLGAVITSNANLGSTTVARGHAAQAVPSQASLARYFDITPTNNTSLKAKLVFHYDDSELNGLTETSLALFRSTDGGATWTKRGGTVDAAANTITLSGIGAFSRWTAAASSTTAAAVSAETAADEEASIETGLQAAYPNPFNPATQFTLTLKEAEHVRLEVFDLLGRRVALLHDGQLEAKKVHRFTFEAGHLASGIYLIRAHGQTFSNVQRVMLLK